MICCSCDTSISCDTPSRVGTIPDSPISSGRSLRAAARLHDACVPTSRSDGSSRRSSSARRPFVRSRRSTESGPALGKSARVEIVDDLYGGEAEQLLGVVRRVPAAAPSVMLIGHNPGIEMLATLLAAKGEALPRLREKFPTGALAALATERSWRELGPGSAEAGRVRRPP